MKPYEWMVKYTAQTEWIERRGVLMWLAEVFSGLGTGLYLVALYFNNLWGMLFGWLIVIVLKGGLHFAYLGKPLRFWRMLLRPQTSWLSRGFIFMLLFIVAGALQLLFSYLLPGSGSELVFKVIAGLLAFLVAIYTGFVMNYVNGIQLWNSSLLPLLFVLSGVLDGFALVITIGLFGGKVDIMAAEAGSRLFLVTAAVFIATYLLSTTYVGAAGKQSVVELVRGSLAPVLWVGVVICGIILPVLISISSAFAGAAPALLVIAIISEMVGAFSLKYCILKAGIYAPLIPSSSNFS